MAVAPSPPLKRATMGSTPDANIRAQLLPQHGSRRAAEAHDRMMWWDRGWVQDGRVVQARTFSR